MILSLLRKYLLPFSTQHLDVVEPLKIKTPKQLQAQLINIFLSKRKENDEQIRLNKIIIYAIIILFVLFLLTLRNKFHIQDLFEKNKEKILNLEETQPEPEIVIAPTQSEDDSSLKIAFLVFFTGGVIFFYYMS
tara:strand:+ start:630 stop:1031 length:402 start_codon:yes stop_codon:yes gene_type:complete